MKAISTIVFVVLLGMAIYILYKLIAVGDLNKFDNILFIILLAGGFLLSAIRYIVKKKQRKDDPIQ